MLLLSKPNNDEFDQRLEDLRERMRDSSSQRERVARVEGKPSRFLGHLSWLLALMAFLGVLGGMWGRVALDPFRSCIVAALVAAIVLFFGQLIISLVMKKMR